MPVVLSVRLGRFCGMMSGVLVMSTGSVRVVRRLIMRAGLVVLSGLEMMERGLFVVLCSVSMVARGFF